MVYVGEFHANLVVYRFCEVLSYKKWTLGIQIAVRVIKNVIDYRMLAFLYCSLKLNIEDHIVLTLRFCQP